LTAPTDARAKVDKIFERYNHTDSPGCVAGATIALTTTYHDGSNSSLGSVRFLRDSTGRMTELSIGEQRVWDMRLRKVR